MDRIAVLDEPIRDPLVDRRASCRCPAGRRPSPSAGACRRADRRGARGRVRAVRRAGAGRPTRDRSRRRRACGGCDRGAGTRRRHGDPSCATVTGRAATSARRRTRACRAAPCRSRAARRWCPRRRCPPSDGGPAPARAAAGRRARPRRTTGRGVTGDNRSSAGRGRSSTVARSPAAPGREPCRSRRGARP